MMRIVTFLGAAFVLLLSNTAQASDAQGYWLTENKRAVIHLQPCGFSLCGTIHWIIDGGMQYDAKNPDKAERSAPMCGLQLLHGFETNGKNWKNGKIYKADEGKIYDANITVKDDNTLSLRGYVGIPLFGKSQTWTRVSPDDYKKCNVAE